MQHLPVIGSVTGDVTPTSWSQVLILPTAYAALEIEDDEGNARVRGIGVLSALAEALNTGPLDPIHLRSIVASVVSPHVISLIILVPDAETIRIVVHGSGQTFVKRGTAFAQLTDGEGEISGSSKPLDTFLLVTCGIMSSLTREQIIRSVDGLTATDIAEKLTLLLHQSDGKRTGSILIFQVPDNQLQQDASFAASVTSQPPDSTTHRPKFSIVSYKPFLRFIANIRANILHRLRELRRRNRLLPLGILCVLFTVFIVSIVIGLRSGVRNGNDSAVGVAMSEARRGLEEGTALADLNPQKGRQRLKDALTTLDAVKQKANDSKQYRDLYKQLEEHLTIAMQIVDVKPEVFYDVTLLTKNAQASGISVTDTNLSVFDSPGQSVFAIGLPSKNGSVLASSTSLRGIRLIASGSSASFVLAEGGIYKVPYTGTVSTKPVIPTDPVWGNIGGFAVYDGNLYLLDTNRHRIWKYSAVDSGFSERREYLLPDIKTDFQTATGLVIDGTVWVGTSDGRILHFQSGQPVVFSPVGVEPAFGKTLYVSTDDSAVNLYVYDREASRVVVLTKEGTYVAQYRFPSGMTPQSVTVSEKNRKGFFILDSVIRSFDLK